MVTQPGIARRAAGRLFIVSGGQTGGDATSGYSAAFTVGVSI